MRVAFDTSVTSYDAGGATRYVNALLKHASNMTGIDLVEINMTRNWRWTANLPRAARILVHDLLWIPFGALRAARRAGGALLHEAAFKVPSATGLPVAVTVHDDLPWDEPRAVSWWNAFYVRRNLARNARELRGILASNETTAALIRARLPEAHIAVTRFGIDHDVFRPRGGTDLAGVGNSPYALMVGPYGARKNYPRMVAALAVVRKEWPELRLVVTGRPAESPTGAAIDVVHMPYLSDNDLAAVYSGAAFLLYASLKEGLGLPVLEAMACACPVVTSRATVMEEISQGAAVLVDPRSVNDIAAGCLRLRDPALTGDLKRRGIEVAAAYDWKETALATARAWTGMAHRA